MIRNALKVDPSDASGKERLAEQQRIVDLVESNADDYKSRLDWRDKTANVESMGEGKTNLYSDDGVPNTTRNYVRDQYNKLSPEVQSNIKAIEINIRPFMNLYLLQKRITV